VEQTSRRKVSPFVWIGLALTLALLLLAWLMALVRLRSQGTAAGGAPPVLAAVAPFALTNQQGVTVTQSDLLGKVWVADVIFTRCAGPCLRMSALMSKLQQRLPTDAAMLVSLTTDPEFDTPEVLAKYASRFDADSKRWMFLTGSKEQIAELGTKSLKFTAIEKSAETRQDPADLFIHSTIFAVVDKKMHLRGVFETEGEGVEPEQSLRRIITLVQQLRNEP